MPLANAAIEFQVDAYETAARFFELLADKRTSFGYIVLVVPVKGEPFEAEVRDVVVGEDDGQYKLVVAPRTRPTDAPDRDHPVTLDIYDELERVEVL